MYRQLITQGMEKRILLTTYGKRRIILNLFLSQFVHKKENIATIFQFDRRHICILVLLLFLVNFNSN